MIDLHEGVLELFAEAQALGPRRASPFLGATTSEIAAVRERASEARVQARGQLFRALRLLARPKDPAPLARVVRWCPACGGRHETTHSADSWRRWHKQVCVALVREKLTTSNV